MIDLAHFAATPVCEAARAAMEPFFRDLYFDPQEPTAASHRVRDYLEQARGQVARLVDAERDGLIFTSSATEANNLAVQGLARAYQRRGRHIILSSMEALSVLNAARALEREGFEVTYLPATAEGWTDPDALRAALRSDTVLVSVTHASLEVGTLQPIAELVAVAREHEVLFHCDGTGVAGILPVSVRDLGVDAYTLSGPTFYAPKGAAALYVRPGCRVRPLMYGGDQEGGWRPGTPIVPNWIGMGAAAEWIRSRLADWQHEIAPRVAEFMRRVEERTQPLGLQRLGPPPGPGRLPNHASFGVRGVDGEAVLIDLERRGILASSGVACGTRAQKRSRALEAMGIELELARGYLLFSASLETTRADLEHTVQTLEHVLQNLPR